MKTHAAPPVSNAARQSNAPCGRGNAILAADSFRSTKPAVSRQIGSKSPERPLASILGLLPDLFAGSEELYDGERYDPSALPPAIAKAAAQLEDVDSAGRRARGVQAAA